MATALMRVCETGDYETAKLLIDEFEEFGGNVNYKIQKIFMDRFIGKTLQEREEILKTIEECNNYEPFDEELREIIRTDGDHHKYLSNNPKYTFTPYYNK